ncbi:MAG: hypothetical protein WKF89_01875 [Chitinophagaceae bacterium]
MNYYFNFTVLFYNTPVFYKVSQIDKNEYYAEPRDSNLASFKFMKKSDQWISESLITRAQARQIGLQIDHLLSPAVEESIVLS